MFPQIFDLNPGKRLGIDGFRDFCSDLAAEEHETRIRALRSTLGSLLETIVATGISA
jgi:hypothetical protein